MTFVYKLPLFTLCHAELVEAYLVFDKLRLTAVVRIVIFVRCGAEWSLTKRIWSSTSSD
jgi:hypothetical protein